MKNTLKSAAVAALVGLSAPAAAAPDLSAVPGAGSCAWGEEIDSIAASMTTVWINGASYYVKGYENRLAFIEELQRCGADDAVVYFELWRRDRRVVNTTALIGLVPVLQPTWVATGIFAVMAGQHKLEMMNAIAY